MLLCITDISMIYLPEVLDDDKQDGVYDNPSALVHADNTLWFQYQVSLNSHTA